MPSKKERLAHCQCCTCALERAEEIEYGDGWGERFFRLALGAVAMSGLWYLTWRMLEWLAPYISLVWQVAEIPPETDYWRHRALATIILIDAVRLGKIVFGVVIAITLRKAYMRNVKPKKEEAWEWLKPRAIAQGKRGWHYAKPRIMAQLRRGK